MSHPNSSQLLESLVVVLLDTPRAEVSLKSKGAKQSATSSTQTPQDSTDDDIAIINVVPKNSVTPTTQQENVTESEDISTIMEPIEFEDVKSKNEEKNCGDTKSSSDTTTSDESDTITSDESDSDNNDELGNSESEESDETKQSENIVVPAVPRRPRQTCVKSTGGVPVATCNKCNGTFSIDNRTRSSIEKMSDHVCTGQEKASIEPKSKESHKTKRSKNSGVPPPPNYRGYKKITGGSPPSPRPKRIKRNL